MPLIATNCPHSDSHGDLLIVHDVVTQRKTFEKCTDCDNGGPNLWLCLYPECCYVGCAEQHLDHSTAHNKDFPKHAAHMNLSSNRIWCYICQGEIHTVHVGSSASSSDHMETRSNKHSGDASLNMDCKADNYEHLPYFRRLNDDGHIDNLMNAEKGDSLPEKSEDSPDSTDSDDSRDFSLQSRGLVGLQNIGNTCYMNSALQALSNVPPLTQFFLDCSHMITYINRDRAHGLCLNYLQLMKDMWSKNTRGYVVPHAILTGIRLAHPMFRGYHQHDTQEFLRCFMDQLHEELREAIEEDREGLLRVKNADEQSSEEEETEADGTEASSQSDAEYETCDSGVSEQSSLSDEGERGTKRRYSRVGQADKLKNKSSNRSSKKGSVDIGFPQLQKSSQGSPTKHRSKKPLKTRSIISDIFDGKLLSSVQCLTCDRISTRIETFQDLSLPIPSRDHIDMLHQGSLTPQKASPCSDVSYTNQAGWISWIWQYLRSWLWGPVVTLHDCLSAFFSADELKGDNMYSCEKCNKLRNGVKYSKVLELPEVLCIHLKRFRHELMFSSKIANYVSFPLEGLVMQPYLHKDCVSKVTTYDLISIICHNGNAGGGHYVCYALNPINQQWFEFDDQCVTPVSSETVKNCEAYVLFYKKWSPEMQQVREKTFELTEISARESSDLNFFVSKQWINRFNTFSEPGPIDNSDFLCSHGGVNPARAKFVDKICYPVRQSVWEFLFKTFGGGPVCTHLYECPICEEKYEAMEKRRQYECEVFNELNRRDTPTALYALAMSWFRQWQSFVKNRETQPPGPIDNSSIVVNKNGQTVLKAGSDYGPIPEELWQFFVNTYGGGPEIILHSCQRPVPTHSSIPAHSASSPNVVDSNPKLSLSRTETKKKQVGAAKSTDAIPHQESSIKLLEMLAKNSSTGGDDAVQTSKEISG